MVWLLKFEMTLAHKPSSHRVKAMVAFVEEKGWEQLDFSFSLA